MHHFPARHSVTALLLSLATIACSAHAPSDDEPGSGTGGPGGGGDGDGPDPDVTGELPDGTAVDSLLPARIRRLTRQEYDSSVRDLLGTAQTPGTAFPPDARQHGYTQNEAQRVDPLLAKQLDGAAISLAEEAILNLNQLAPCSDPVGGAAICAASFIDSFVPRAYRRPITTEEKEGLVLLYQAAMTGEGAHAEATPETQYAEGIALVIRGVLQSPGFLYTTEIGAVGDDKTVELTQQEVAVALAFLFSGGPPDSELLAAAAAGELHTGEARGTQARRLLKTERGQARAVTVVREWLGIDRIAVTDKDATVFPDFAAAKPAIEAETAAFVTTSLSADGGALATFLNSTFPVDPALSVIYGSSGERRGLLNQAAFLSVYAHAHETAPILRGTAILRRVACVDVEIPTALNLVIVPPAPDPGLTTRERFDIHTKDAACSSCHAMIDPLGFSFEGFDGIGVARTEEKTVTAGTEEVVMKPIESAGTVSIGKDFDGTYADSSGLAAALSQSAEVSECFARQLFRATVGEGQDFDAVETAFLEQWRALPDENQSILTESLVALAASDLFFYRKTP